MLTKIVATIGPKSDSEKELTTLLEAGVGVVRVNFSHANYKQYRQIKKIVDKYNAKHNKEVKIMLDLQGPRIRVGEMPKDGILMHEAEIYEFIYSRQAYRQPGDYIPIDSPDLYKHMKKGAMLFLCNGAIELKVLSVNKKVIKAEVLNGGILNSRKSINVPDTIIKKGGMTAKDIKDVKFGLKTGMDYIALSFVQSADDVKRLRRLLGKNNKVKIISKIERGVALKNIDKIIASSDMIMVARGDLGIETPIEELPIIQKNLVRHAHWHNRPVIIATQVMTSMIKNPHPTRAEVSDIANAVYDGADMIMLSDETTVGEYPLAAVKMLRKVIERTEYSMYKSNLIH
jgi:pyruvate kinase